MRCAKGIVRRKTPGCFMSALRTISLESYEKRSESQPSAVIGQRKEGASAKSQLRLIQ